MKRQLLPALLSMALLLAGGTAGVSLGAGLLTMSSAVLAADAVTGGTGVLTPAQNSARYDHVVIAIMENESSTSIFASNSTLYIHSLAAQGVRFTAARAVTHPSEPNYIALFSGSTQGITDDSCPNNFSGANLGSQLIGAGLSFKGYSDGMPSNGYAGCSSGRYARKHNPWVMFKNLPTSTNLTFSSFPTDYTQLPTVSVVVPDLCNDMHDCSFATGDNWLKNKLDRYVQWAKTHNSLFILMFDEDDGAHNNVIPVVFVGANVPAGVINTQSFNHYGMLRTLEDMYGLSPLNNAASVSPVTGWRTSGGSSNGWTAQSDSLSAPTGASWTFTMNLPTGASNLKFTTSGGSGDADVYVKFGAAPTPTSYECQSASSGSNNESCTISNPQSGTYYVLVRANASFSGVVLNGSFTR